MVLADLIPTFISSPFHVRKERSLLQDKYLHLSNWWSSQKSNVAPQIISLYSISIISLSSTFCPNPFLSFSPISFDLFLVKLLERVVSASLPPMILSIHHNLPSVPTTTLELLWETLPMASNQSFPYAILNLRLTALLCCIQESWQFTSTILLFQLPWDAFSSLSGYSLIIFLWFLFFSTPNCVVSAGYHLVSYCM